MPLIFILLPGIAGSLRNVHFLPVRGGIFPPIAVVHVLAVIFEHGLRHGQVFHECQVLVRLQVPLVTAAVDERFDVFIRGRYHGGFQGIVRCGFVQEGCFRPPAPAGSRLVEERSCCRVAIPFREVGCQLPFGADADEELRILRKIKTVDDEGAALFHVDGLQHVLLRDPDREGEFLRHPGG